MKESVKIDSKVVDRVRAHVKKTGQTISGCIEVTLINALDEWDGKAILTDYASGMAPSLLRSINATRKNKRK
jgi:hypothetical protein